MTRLLLLPAALVAAAATLASTPWTPAPDPRPAQDHEESALGQSMDRMKGALRRMERTLESDDPAQVLPILAEFQANAVAAKSEVPARAATLQGAERATFVKDYRATMVQLLRVTCDLEQALLDQRMADATRIFASELKALQKPSHERFQVEDD